MTTQEGKTRAVRTNDNLLPGPASAPQSDVCLPNILLPGAHKRRERVIADKKETLKTQVCADFMELQKRYEKTGSKNQAYLDWGQQHVEKQYPGLGRDVAHAVPYFFIGRQDLRVQQKVGLFQHIQESQIRGDTALSRVNLALRLLSNKREQQPQTNSQDRKTPLMILGTILNEHILKWPERLHEIYPDIICPDMAKQAGQEFKPYYIRPFETNIRGEIDILVLDQQAHVIIFEVKAFGLYHTEQRKTQRDRATSKRQRNPWHESYKQLQTARDNFYQLFPEKEFCHINVHRVIAMPNISLPDAQAEFGFDVESLKKELVYMLTKENLVEETFDRAESQYDLSKFEDWWEKNMSTATTTDLSSDLMKIVVARYIGTLSRPLGMSLNQQRHQIRTPCDAIEISCTIFESLCFYIQEDKEQAVKSMTAMLGCCQDQNYKKVYIKGPPGSGKTTLAILKARNFLSAVSNAVQTLVKRTHVIVIDISRGSRGRSVGLHVYNSILDSHEQFRGRVHYLPFDVNTNVSEEHFAEEVIEIIGNNDIETEDLMFILDEILPVHFWEDILLALDQDIYQKSYVWLTDGLVPQHLGAHEENFHTVKMRSMTRIPRAVQKVLYHVDWCDNKMEKYQPGGYNKSVSNTDQVNITAGESLASPHVTHLKTSVSCSTHGPIPLAIRHQNHGSANIMDCENCAEELADLLVHKLRLVDEISYTILPCSTVILFSIPLALYTDTVDGHVEITKDRYQEYAEIVKTCRFVQRIDKLIPGYVDFITADEVGIRKDLEQEEFWNKILVGWVETFQGLIKDVVIYLPSELSSLARGKELLVNEKQILTKSVHRKIPWPGTAPCKQSKLSPKINPPRTLNDPTTIVDLKVLLHVTDSDTASVEIVNCRAETTTSVSRLPKCLHMDVLKCLQADPLENEQKREEDRKLAHMYWRTEDIERYTEWDQTNLMFAASRCAGQLILIVP